MSLFSCIQDAIEAKEMDPTRGREAQRRFIELRDSYIANRIDPDTASAAAAADVKKIMAATAGEKRRTTLLRLQAARRNTAALMQHRTVLGRPDMADGLRVLITGDEMSPIQGIAPLASTLRGFYHGELGRVLSAHRRNLFGSVTNKAGLEDLTRALFGEKPASAAVREMADAVRHTLDLARRDHNAAGGHIGHLEDYGLPMQHNGSKIEDAGEEAWKAEIWNRLDWTRIKDNTTERPFSPSGDLPPPRGSRAEEFLSEVYANITTQGWAKREASFQERGLAMANRRNVSRVLHFRSGDDWLEYNARFGSQDPFSTIVTALDGYARDTAAMRVLGPNPTAGITYLGQFVLKRAQEAPWLETRAKTVRAAEVAANKAQVMLDLHTGAAQTPVDSMLAGFMAGVRQVLVSAQLGAAAISAVTDVGFQSAAARKVGILPTKMMARLGKELVGDPANATRKGLIADQMANVGSAQARYVGEAYAPEVAERLSDFVMRASGLTRWTEAGRHAFQLEFMGMLADNAPKPLAAIEPALRQVLERRGFTAADWDKIRNTDLHNEDGATFLIPQMIRYRIDMPAAERDELAMRLMSVIHEQTEFAVPSSSLEGQAIFSGQSRPGTFIGELARSGAMYKNFGMSVLFNQYRRMLSHSTKWSRLGYLGTMGALVTAMGAISLQMKEIVKGRDPRPMDNWQFVGAAGLQGGGLGIFGDFLAAEQNRFGGGIEETLAGPVFGAAGDLISLGISGAKAPFVDDSTVGREATQFLRYNTPVTGIWYWGSAFQRLVYDNLQRAVDPDAERAWRRAERRRVSNYGNPAWWAPGQNLPQRGPDWSNALP